MSTTGSNILGARRSRESEEGKLALFAVPFIFALGVTLFFVLSELFKTFL